MATLHPEARKLLESDALAHMVTLNRDGSPQVSCVWVSLDGDEILSAHLPRNQKVRNVERDPRVSLSVEGTGHNGIGLRDYLVVHGRARIQEGGAAALLQDWAKVYLGPDADLFSGEDHPPGYVLRITPERFGGSGPWVESSG
jgi:PPOX class probable F420-dependent enzyme